MDTEMPAAEVVHAHVTVLEATVELEDTNPAAAELALSVHDYACPICIELLLRPVTLSCGHRFCRACWVRVLQSRDVCVTAHRSGNAACPFRCDVRPVVPEVDQALASELEALFGVQYTERTPSYYALPDEERKAAEVNAWAAAGCALVDTTEEVAMRGWMREVMRAEEVALVRVQQLLRFISVTLGMAGMLLILLLGLLLVCVMASNAGTKSVDLLTTTKPALIVLFGMSATLALLDGFLACCMLRQRKNQRRTVWGASRSRHVQPAPMPGQDVAV